MTILQQTITIILCALGTMLTRFLPFLWKRQMLLSIAGGTVCYMLLVQFVF